MRAIDRFRVVRVSTNFNLLLIMGVAYGLLFGGIGQGFALAAGETTIGKFFLTILMYGAIYECMFLFVIIVVIIAINIKGFLSLGMERRTVYQIWRDVIVAFTIFMTLVFNGVIWAGVHMDGTLIKARALNINFNDPKLGEIILLAVFITLLMLFLNLSGSVITNIGNRFGLTSCFGTICILVGGIVLSIPSIIKLALWGDGMLTFCG
ncbi:MAG: hypothetical protein H7X94_04715, partial [Vallitaleaceae bacterium]|nr:hypothetical protein [Vallitaleaceae bacterium]